jgi:hypothetical protein
MRPKDQRQMLVTILFAVITSAAVGLLLAGVEVAALKELLAVIFPPLIALTAAGVGRGGG